MSKLWILGAPDPEMTAIETLLRSAGEKVAYAIVLGKRVTPGTAYKADGQTCDSLEGLDEIVLVECELPGFFASDPSPKVTSIDHHRPGDPGHGKPPAEFMGASSIGQAIRHLIETRSLPDGWPRWVGVMNAWPSSKGEGVYEKDGQGWSIVGRTWPNSEGQWVRYIIPEETAIVAAADHCLSRAYDGECPGVNPEALMAWRAASRAAFQKRTVKAVLADVKKAREALLSAVNEPLGRGFLAKDLRGQDVPELPEAAAREGMAFLATVKEKDGREKIVLMAGSPGQIEAFLEEWAPARNLKDRYGDPQRGYCGAYL